MSFGKIHHSQQRVVHIRTKMWRCTPLDSGIGNNLSATHLTRRRHARCPSGLLYRALMEFSPKRWTQTRC